MLIPKYFSASRFITLLVFWAAVLMPAPARAVQGFKPIDPEELKMTSDPQAPGAAAVILYRQVDRDDNGKTSHQDDYVRIKILKEEGRKYADVEIPYLREGGSGVNTIRARTINPDGSIIDFNGKVFHKTIVKARGVKYQAETFTLPGVQVGSIIEYRYTIDLSENFIYDSHWILSQDLYTRHAQFSLKPYHSDYIPVSVRWTSLGLPAATQNAKEGPDGIVRLEVSNIPAFRSEDFMPPENEVKARVDFVYSEGTPDMDPGKFWSKIGKQRNGHLESFVGKHKAMERAVDEIVASGDEPEVKLRKIYDRVQQLRNTSFEVQKTAQEEKRDKDKAPANAEDVWKAQAGTGTELTWLFLALVRAAGFEADGVWACDRRYYFFYPAALDENRLDTNVVLVKMNGKDLYLDPGTAFVPFGLLPWDETGVAGLKMEKDGGGFITTTLPESSASQIQRHATLKLSDTGDLEGKLTITYTGLEGMLRRVEERHADDAARKEYLENEVKGYIPAACEVELVNKPDWQSSEPPLVAEFNLKVPGWSSRAGSRALLPVGLFARSEKHLFDSIDRQYPIYFNYPSQKVDDVSIDLPAGWKVGSLPQNQDVIGHVLNFKFTVYNDGANLHWQRMLDENLLMLDKKYYEALRNFFQKVNTTDDEQILLQPTAMASN